MNKKERLLQCKCEKTPRLVICGVGSYVRCPWCNTGTMMCTAAEDAVKIWNEMMKENNMPNKENDPKNNKIVSVKIEQIHPHPDNPRKDLGDLEELVKSIKLNGVMQNLTLIPGYSTENGEKKEDEYTLLIGHRRHAAAVKAGLTELPCRIVDNLTHREQVGIMLEENMQRNDLTIYEQAQGFQMMLDLGETEETIAEKTGFSRSTIRHRLNIAKLDQKILKDKERNDVFQLSLKDLYALEKISDINTRNKILREATDSRSLTWRAQQAADEEVRDKRQKQIVEMLKKQGIKKAPKTAENEQYTGKWSVVKEISLEKEVPKRIVIPKEEQEVFYLPYYRNIRIITEQKKRKKELSERELAEKQRDRNKKKIKAMIKEMNTRRREFILSIISGQIEPLKEDQKIKDEVWYVLAEDNVYLSLSAIRRLYTNKSDYDCTKEERAEAEEWTKNLSVLHQMLSALHYAMENIGDIFDWQGYFKTDIGQKLRNSYEILERYGWSHEEEEEQLLNGQHELYAKKEQE